MKTSTTVLIVLLVVASVFAGSFFLRDLGTASVTSQNQIVDSETGELKGQWSNTIVYYKLSVKDKYAGTDVSATAKVYDEMPEDWGNPRGDFDEASEYTIYSASSGIVTINEEFPGKYYVVMTATGYNTEFVEIIIPDGTGRSIDVSDYNQAPDQKPAPMSLVGAVTDEDFAFTLVNDSSSTEKDSVILTINENTELRGWKVIVNDEEGFSLDTDGDGVYDEGVSRFYVSVGGVAKTIFDPDKGIDLFDSNDEYTLQLEDLVVADESDLVIKVEIDAVTGDYTGANDEVWGEGEGVLSYIKIYDDQGNLFSTVDVTA